MGGAGWAGLRELPPQPKKHQAVWGEVGGCLRLEAGYFMCLQGCLSWGASAAPDPLGPLGCAVGFIEVLQCMSLCAIPIYHCGSTSQLFSSRQQVLIHSGGS